MDLLKARAYEATAEDEAPVGNCNGPSQRSTAWLVSQLLEQVSAKEEIWSNSLISSLLLRCACSLNRDLDASSSRYSARVPGSALVSWQHSCRKVSGSPHYYSLRCLKDLEADAHSLLGSLSAGQCTKVVQDLAYMCAISLDRGGNSGAQGAAPHEVGSVVLLSYPRKNCCFEAAFPCVPLRVLCNGAKRPQFILPGP
jgi:hypothetical protein